MSKKGDYYDNAALGNWNHRLKVRSYTGREMSGKLNFSDYQVVFIDS